MHRGTKILRNQLPWGLAIAAALLLVVSIGVIFHLNREYARQNAWLQQELGQVEHLQAELKHEQAFADFLRTPELRATRLSGTPKNPAASGIVFWNPREARVYFFASHLPIPPAGKTYQLWLITDKPISAGVFEVDAIGVAEMQTPALGEMPKAQKFAVTLETAGGVPQPTGEMHLLGVI